MPQSETQTFANHTRFVPAYHMILFPILLINLIWSAYKLVRYFSFDTLVTLLVAVALLIITFYMRIFALTVQDRVIRLEMWLRMEKLLAADLRAHIPEFTVSQLVALRFAGDEELPELARRVLSENIASRKAIKKLIAHWKPDTLRA